MTPYLTPRRAARRAATTMLAAALCVTAGCNEFLIAENPGAIEVDDLNTVGYVSLLANGPVFAFQAAHDDVAYWNGQFTDELVNRGNVNPFVEEGQIDRRELYTDMSYINAFLYAPLQRARFSGEDAAARLKIILGDTASRDLRVARSLAYAGYSYVYLGEMMCTTPIDLGAPKSSADIFGDALARFAEAITTATAARDYALGLTPANTALAAAADSVRHFALVGSARAALNRDEKPQAITFANQVPASFEFRSYYSDNSAGERNRTWDRLGAGNNATLAGTPFEAMADDPRVPRSTAPAARVGTPLSPSSYSTFSNTVAGGALLPNATVRVASGLEARYIVAEAQGATPATLAFVNERRAAGLQTTPVALAGDALMAELRDQRSRDFYLDNHRLGDLRRYKQFYNVDLFPKGAYPGSTTGQVYDETITCWPLPRNEINENPNIPNG
ncbi:MAG TPA: RagB/SusD family nutrient uptake outer membrane protein [Gemmatimonadaceae bacterium]|nr:RagB/SusD family nutrient uptake outer membrane protein [Gemmatimonadaceae bacterium]